jgi:proline iminopeptidase
MKEGFIETRGGKVWYGIAGQGNEIPLIVVHGGPGYPHDSLEPLVGLSNERKVIFYDQLGCGNSQKVNDKSLWTLEYYLSELEEVVKHLRLNQFHLIGNSWGAALAAAYCTHNPKGVKSLILADPYLSTSIWEKDAKKLLSKFPKSFQQALTGDPQTKEYKEALEEFYFKHLYGQRNLSVQTLKAEFKMNLEQYNYMWGPQEFDASGTLKNFDLSGDLHKIKVPTLLICGRSDEATPESTEYFKNLIPNSQMKVFEKSAHMPHWTERKEYMKTIRKFLKSA